MKLGIGIKTTFYIFIFFKKKKYKPYKLAYKNKYFVHN